MTTYTVVPFSGAHFRKNSEAAYSSDLTPCAICGKGVKDLSKAIAVTVINGGADWGDRDSEQDSGYMGEWPMGPDCHRKYRRN